MLNYISACKKCTFELTFRKNLAQAKVKLTQSEEHSNSALFAWILVKINHYWNLVDKSAFELKVHANFTKRNDLFTSASTSSNKWRLLLKSIWSYSMIRSSSNRTIREFMRTQASHCTSKYILLAWPNCNDHVTGLCSKIRMVQGPKETWYSQVYGCASCVSCCCPWGLCSHHSFAKWFYAYINWSCKVEMCTRHSYSKNYCARVGKFTCLFSVTACGKLLEKAVLHVNNCIVRNI